MIANLLKLKKPAPAGDDSSVPCDVHEPQAAVISVDDLLHRLGTSAKGLSQQQAMERLERHGPNSVTLDVRVPVALLLRENFGHTMALLLWVAGGIAFIAQMPQLCVAIWLVNILNGAFSFFQEYRAERATEALQKLLPASSTVVRDGKPRIVPAAVLVPGDLILVGEGDRISADARLISSQLLAVDQSTLTGESRIVFKNADDVTPAHCSLSNGATSYDLANLLFAGTTVSSGHGTAVVYATGMATEFGRIAGLTQRVVTQPSPLQREMIRVTKVISALAVGVGVIMFLLAASITDNSLGQAFVFSMGMIVAFVPEGMVPTVTLSLAMAVQRMARRNALVKRLSSVETLGCTHVICTDKTGTLTQNKMTVTNCWVGERDYDFGGAAIESEGSEVSMSNAPALAELLRAGILCNNATIGDQPTSASNAGSGDPTEICLLWAARKMGIEKNTESLSLPRIQETPFDSHRKCMSTIHGSGAQNIMYVKGSVESILCHCTNMLTDKGEVALDDTGKEMITKRVNDFALQGLRVMVTARAILPASNLNAEPADGQLTFLGIVSMQDPPRAEVGEAIGKCHEAGIKVVMITGDYQITAEAIAHKLGILKSGSGMTITGSQLNRMSDQELTELVSHNVIFARVNPEHKLRIVQAYQRRGMVVAVTGDGVNDGPALKQADIGIAMGASGTDVAREAADVILLDDNFASIVNAVEEGRAVYENIKKFAVYVFNSNMAEAVPFIVMLLSCGIIPLPLTVMQVLSIDLGTDMVPAIALGADVAEPGIMSCEPRRSGANLLTASLLALSLLWYGMIEACAGMCSYFYCNSLYGWPAVPLAPVGSHVYSLATTMTLAAIVAAQVGAVFCCRTHITSIFRADIFRNRLILVGVAFELLVLAGLVYVPFLQGVFNTAALDLRLLSFAFAWTPLIVALDEMRKWILRRRQRHNPSGAIAAVTF